MSVYCGINGITRQSEPVIKAGNLYYSDGKNSESASVVHPHTGMAGVNGITRKILLPTDIIQKIIWRSVKYYVQHFQSEGWTEISEAQISSYGTVSVSGNTITVFCNREEYVLDISGTFFVVFKDGSEYSLNYLINPDWNRGRETVISSFQINLDYTLSVQTGSDYPKAINSVWCFGNLVSPDSWGNSGGIYSDSGTVSSLVKNKWSLEILAGNETSNWAQTKVTINSFLLNGISFPFSLEG